MSFYLAANRFHRYQIMYFWGVKIWDYLSLNRNRRIHSGESYTSYKSHTAQYNDADEGCHTHTHIHLCKHRWPKHAGPSICLKLPSCSIRSSSLTVNLYTIISSPVLTRHLMLWVAKCLWARTARPLLLLVLCPHACASNIKGQMGEKNYFPEPPLLKGSLLPTGCVKAFIFF